MVRTSFLGAHLFLGGIWKSKSTTLSVNGKNEIPFLLSRFRPCTVYRSKVGLVAVVDGHGASIAFCSEIQEQFSYRNLSLPSLGFLNQLISLQRRIERIFKEDTISQESRHVPTNIWAIGR
jgi:hypothetical protein